MERTGLNAHPQRPAAKARGCTCEWWGDGSIVDFDPACPLIDEHRPLSDSANPPKEPTTDWTWHGTPGHFVGAYSCCFRLHTTVGSFRVSSVGCYHPYGDRSSEPHEIGSQRLYETMVFRNDGPSGEPESWSELDSDAYNDQDAATAGHIAMCHKWAARSTLTADTL